MKNLTRTILAGTALGLVTAGGAVAAPALSDGRGIDRIVTGPTPQRVLRLAQAESADEEELEEEDATEQPPAPEPAPQQPAESTEQPPAENQSSEPEEPAAEEPAPRPTQAEEPAVEEPVEEEASEPEAAPQPPADTAEEPAEQPAEQEATEPEAAPQPPAATAEEPAEQPADDQQRRPRRQTGEPATEPTPDARPVQRAEPEGEEVLPENAAPVLDSQKPRRGEGGRRQDRVERPAVPPADAPPPPANDSEAQAETIAPEDIRPVTAEEGRRIEGRDRPRRERREGADVLREIGDRILFEIGNQLIVEGSDRPRLERDARDVYYEELPRGRTRETIIRRDGTQVVTIRDRYGEIIRRSRITPDGREYVLVYVDEERRGRRDGRWRDPGDDLPPLVLTIPVRDYILDAGRYSDPDDYYEFLDQPPVERIERLYSIDEVRHSPRIRDSVRRIDLDTITFGFGSADIAEGEVRRLEAVATAMQRLLERNPAETFLIEGHTDAVGTNQANLVLSDRRAETVAAALTDVFDIPPENLVTQGYGEEYLKIDTQEPEQENRRVAIRRITPLVAPVAANQ